MRIIVIFLAAFVAMILAGGASAQNATDPECAGLDDEACEDLAQDYLAGTNGIENDDAKALKLFSALCDRGLFWSCFKTARVYQYGWGVPRTMENYQKALDYHELACMDDVAQACSAAAGINSGTTIRNLERAQLLARKGCTLGDVQGCVLIDTETLPMSDSDRDAIFTHFEGKCEAGDMEACFGLAQIHKASAFGYEFEKARRLHERACKGGHVDACAAGARAYDDVDRFKAEELQARGCALGRQKLCSPFNKTFVESHEDCVNRNVNIETACASWGRYLWDGDGVPQDKAEGMVQFRRSCEADGGKRDSMEANFACHMVDKAGHEYP